MSHHITSHHDICTIMVTRVLSLFNTIFVRFDQRKVLGHEPKGPQGIHSASAGPVSQRCGARCPSSFWRRFAASPTSIWSARGASRSPGPMAPCRLRAVPRRRPRRGCGRRRGSRTAPATPRVAPCRTSQCMPGSRWVPGWLSVAAPAGGCADLSTLPAPGTTSWKND